LSLCPVTGYSEAALLDFCSIQHLNMGYLLDYTYIEGKTDVSIAAPFLTEFRKRTLASG